MDSILLQIPEYINRVVLIGLAICTFQVVRRIVNGTIK